MDGKKTLRIKFCLALVIILPFVLGTTDPNEIFVDSKLDVTDEISLFKEDDNVKETSFMNLKDRFSSSPDLSNCIEEHDHNIFNIDIKKIEDYMQLITNDLEYFEEVLSKMENSIKKNADFKFLYRFCIDAASMIYKDEASQVTSFERLEDVLNFVDDIPKYSPDIEISEVEFRNFENFYAESKELIEKSRKNLKRETYKYNFCKSIIYYKKVEITALNFFIALHYAKIVFSDGFFDQPGFNELYCDISAAKKFRKTMLSSKILSEIQDKNQAVLPKLEGKDLNRNAEITEKAENLIKERYKNEVLSDEYRKLKGKSIEELYNIQKELKLELTEYEDDFRKIENSRNIFAEKFNNCEQKYKESFYKFVLEFYKLRKNLFSFFMRPKKSEKLQNTLTNEISMAANNLFAFYFNFERKYGLYFELLDAFLKKTNSLKKRIITIQKIINKAQNKRQCFLI